MRKALLALILLTAGCTIPTTWDKEGGTQAQFNVDEYECQQASYGYGGVSGYGTVYRGAAIGGLGRTQNGQIYRSCMRAKGYASK